MTSKQYDQFGPHIREEGFFDQFIFGNKIYTLDGKIEDAFIDSGMEVRGNLMGPAKRADLATWKGLVSPMAQSGMEFQAFTLLAGFGSIFMHLLSDTEGGAMINLTTPKSGSGKTTALQAAQSIWGRIDATGINNFDTINSTLANWSIIGVLPVVCDEKAYKSKNAELIIQLMQMFTKGCGKGRCDKHGKPVPSGKPWHCILLGASNTPFIELASEGGDKAMAARVLELLAEIPEGIKDKGDIKKQLQIHSGVAGHAFLQYVMKPEVQKWIYETLPTICEDFKEYSPLLREEDMRFIRRILACVYISGVIVDKIGLFNCNPKKLVDWAISTLSTRKESLDLGSKPKDVLSHIISSHLQDALIVSHAYERGKTPTVFNLPKKDGIHIRHDGNTGRCYIDVKSFAQYCKMHGDINRTWLISECRKLGIIEEKIKEVTLAAGQYANMAPSPCYSINMKHPMMSGTLSEVVEFTKEKPALVGKADSQS